MRILLLGEYSGFYANLARGFEQLGCDVTLFSNGHGMMRIQGGTPYPEYGSGLIGGMKRRLLWKHNLKKFSGFDVVFVISPEFVKRSWQPWYWDRIREANQLVVYTVCGQIDSNVLRHSPFYRKNMFIDKYGKVNIESTAEMNRSEYVFCDRMVSECDAIITISPDYAVPYESVINKPKACIPLPIDSSSIQPRRLPSRRLAFVHGKQHRPFLKGSDEILEAFETLQRIKPIEFSFVGGLSLSEYQNVLVSNHVIVDQCKSLGYGMNALYAMALGRIVMSGNEPEFQTYTGLPPSPVINIVHDNNQILEVATEIVGKSNEEICKLADESRQYVLDHHDSRNIAKAYIEFIQSSL